MNKIVLSNYDRFDENTLWCGSFQLVWNELKEKYNDNKNIKFKDGDILDVKHLNTSLFNKDKINENSCYVKSGYKTFVLKNEIEKAIKDKFNQTSDVLKDIEFEEETTDLLLYAMLYKNFKFEVPFANLGTRPFLSCSKNRKIRSLPEAEYFGIDKEDKNYHKMMKQLHVLYYDSENRFGIKISTNTNDEIIICTGIQRSNFKGMYRTLKELEEKYTGNRSLNEEDTFSMPYINIKEKVDFDSLINHPFDITVDHMKKEYCIAKAVQTITFKLNEQGGKVKSEAYMMNVTGCFNPMLEKEIRYFDVNNRFTLFLKEKDADMPYLALYVVDAEDIQKESD